MHYGQQNENDDIIRDAYGEEMVEMDAYDKEKQSNVKKREGGAAQGKKKKPEKPVDVAKEKEKKVKTLVNDIFVMMN